MKKQACFCLIGLSVFVLMACGKSTTPVAPVIVQQQPKAEEKAAPPVAEKVVVPEPKEKEKAPSPDDPRNIEGFGKTRWGMTEQEVFDAEKERVERLDEPVPFGASGKPPIGIATMVIKRFEIDRREYEAFFLFDSKDHRLVRVLIRSLVTDDAIRNDQRFVSIEKLLTEKYGPPTFSTSRKQRSESSQKSVASWKLSTTSIELEHSVIAIADGSLLTLVYQPVETSEETASGL